MTCDACTRAERAPRTNEFTVGCESCKARALAAIGAHEESRAAGRMTKQYRDALGALFGNDWEAGNAAVKTWATRIGQADEPPRESAPTRKKA